MADQGQDEAAMTSGETRNLIKNFTKVLKGVRPSTADTPPNVTDADLAREVKDKQRNVDRSIDASASYIQQQGFRSLTEKVGTRYWTYTWHHSEGEGESGDLMPKSMKGQSGGEKLQEIQAENAALARRVDALTRELATERGKHKSAIVEGLQVEADEPIVVTE